MSHILNDFAVFICTHGRPDKQYTLRTLRKLGYTGKILLMLDNEDESYKYYHHNLGECDDILCFDKKHYIDIIDSGANHPKRNVHLYAWCAVEDYAVATNKDYFIVADDDITGFRYRYIEDGHLKSLPITKDLDSIFENYIDFLKDTDICSVSFGTSPMYMGGEYSYSRSLYNFIFRNGKKKFHWTGEIYEDVISYILENQRGNYTVALPNVQLNMMPIDAGASGGMSLAYDSLSEFEKMGYVLEFVPSCVKYTTTKDGVGYKIFKDSAFPKLISSCYQK